MKHHIIRYSVFFIILNLIIIANECKNKNSFRQPIYQTITTIFNIYKIIPCINTKEYYNILDDKLMNIKKILPILKYNNIGDYNKYYKELMKHYESIKNKIKKINTSNLVELNYMESILLFHLIEIERNKKYSQMPITDLYDIIDLYKNSSDTDKNKYLDSHYLN